MRTIYPVPSEPLLDDTANIQAALDAATDGVIFSPGVYTISRALRLKNRSSLRLFGFEATIQATLNGAFLDITGATDLEIAGLRFLGAYSGADTPPNQEAITANPGVTNLNVHDCTFDTITTGVFVGGDTWSNVLLRHNKFISTNAAIAIGSGTGSHLKIQDNEFVDSATLSSDDSIAIAGQATGVIITGNYIDKKASGSILRAHGIFLGPTSGTGVSHVVIADNVVRNNTTSGVNPTPAIEAVDSVGGQLNNIVISGNVLDGDYSGIGLTPLTTDTILVRGNLISSPTQYGINGNAGSGTGAISIVDNIVVNPGNIGIYMALAANLLYANNQVSGGANRGIVADQCANAVLVSNRAWGNAGINILINASTGAIASTNYPTPTVQ